MFISSSVAKRVEAHIIDDEGQKVLIVDEWNPSVSWFTVPEEKLGTRCHIFDVRKYNKTNVKGIDIQVYFDNAHKEDIFLIAEVTAYIATTQ